MFGVQGFRVQGAGCRVQGAGFNVQGFRVQGAGMRESGPVRMMVSRMLSMVDSESTMGMCGICAAIAAHPENPVQ